MNSTFPEDSFSPENLDWEEQEKDAESPLRYEDEEGGGDLEGDDPLGYLF